MIKRNRLEREAREKRAQEEKQRQALETKLIEMAKTHNTRKDKKKQVKGMLEEAIQILYLKEDIRRDQVLKKIKRSNPKAAKGEVNFEQVTVPFNTALFAQVQKKMNRRTYQVNQRRKTLSQLRMTGPKAKKIKDYNHDDLLQNNEMMRTLMRKHALEKIEGIYPVGDIEKSVKSMTYRMSAPEMATMAKSIQKDLGIPPKPVIR